MAAGAGTRRDIDAKSVRILTLEEAAEAHQPLKGRKVTDKIVLEVRALVVRIVVSASIGNIARGCQAKR
jgi:hypothetical protein